MLTRCLKPIAIAAMLLIFYGCSDPDVDIISDPAKPRPVPGKSCSGNVADGYCDKLSYLPGEKVKVYINATENISDCALTIFSLSKDSIFSIGSTLHKQEINSAEPWSDGFGYTITVEFTIPENTSSGIYTVQGVIPFIVKPITTVDLLVVYPSNTANGYCESGGKSLYTTDRATKVSFHRPIGLENFSAYSLAWFHKFPGLTTGFICDTDLEDYPTMSNTKVLCFVGHNEYWTRRGRENFDQFINGGKHALILSGNTMWWQVRYSGDYSQMICYKDKDTDPVADPLFKTIRWTDELLQYPTIASIGEDFNRGGYGTKSDDGWNGYKIINAGSPLLEGLNLTNGDVISCPTVEYDGAPIASFDGNGYPVLDLQTMGALKGEIIGFDKGFRSGETVGTFIIYQRSLTSGIIINTGSTNWCSSDGIGGKSGDQIKAITVNAIKKLINNDQVFSN